MVSNSPASYRSSLFEIILKACDRETRLVLKDYELKFEYFRALEGLKNQKIIGNHDLELLETLTLKEVSTDNRN